MAIFPGSAIPSAVSDYEIENSVRFDDGSSPLLRRTPTATGDRQKMTWSAWVKKCYQNLKRRNENQKHSIERSIIANYLQVIVCLK